jgi:peptide chain release factor 2
MSNCSLRAWVKPRTIFDVPALTAKIQDLEQVASQPDFWDNQAQAQSTLQELNEYKSHLEQFDRWKSDLADAEATIELLELEDDQALLEEAEAKTEQLKRVHRLRAWRT